MMKNSLFKFNRDLEFFKGELIVGLKVLLSNFNRDLEFFQGGPGSVYPPYWELIKLWKSIKIAILCGDYNLAKTTWLYQDSLLFSTEQDTSSRIKVSSALICNGYAAYDLQQCYPIYHSKGYSLDLMFGEPGTIKYLHSDDQLVPPDILHHIGSTFSINCEFSEIEYKHSAIYNFRKMDLEALLTCLWTIDWDYLLRFDLFGLEIIQSQYPLPV